jgi:hypothetical protein
LLPQSAFLAGAAEPEREIRQWYGYQIMAADLASAGLAIFGSQAAVGEIGLLVGPSVIHGIHGRTGLAITSPVLRVLLPVAGALIGASATPCSNTQDDSSCAMGGAILGGGIGLLTAMILDWSLAWQTVEAPATFARESEKQSHTSGFHLTAAGVSPTASGATLVLGGRF